MSHEEILAVPIDAVRRRVAALRRRVGATSALTAEDFKTLELAVAALEETERRHGEPDAAGDLSSRKHAEEALRDHEAHLQFLIGRIPGFIWTTDRDLRLTLRMGRGLEAIDAQRSDALGLRIGQFFGREDADFPPIAAHRRALAGHEATYEQEWEGRVYSAGVEPLRSAAGAITGVIGVAFDITERTRAEHALLVAKAELETRVAERTAALTRANEQLRRELSERERVAETLRQSEERFASAFEFAPIGMALFALDGRPLQVNRTLCEMLGYSAQALLAIGVYQLIHTDDLRAAAADHFRLVSGEISCYRAERRYIHQSGRVMLVLMSASLVHDRDGDPLHTIGQLQDITERKQAEAALRESEERFHNAFQYAPVGMALVARDRRFLRVNPVLCDILGYAEAELLAIPVTDLIHPDDLAAAVAAGDRLAAGEIASYQTERRYLHKSGGVISAQLSVSIVRDRDGTPLFHIFQLQDITERKHAEDALRLQSLVLEGMAEGVSVGNQAGIMLFTNPAFEAMFGYDPGELLGKHVSILNADPPEESARVAAMVLAQIAAKGAFAGDFHNRRKDGTPFLTFARINTVTVAGEQLWLNLQHDITGRRRAEEALRRSEERFALAVAGANDGLWDWNIETDEGYLSARGNAILGFEEQEMETGSGPWLSRVHPEDQGRVNAAFEAHLGGRSSHLETEYRVRRKDGTYRWVLVRGLAVRDPAGRPRRMAGSLTDVTERRRAEERARQHQAESAHALRLSTLGEMVAGLSHEINQPLSAIVSYARGCAHRLRAGTAEPNDLLAAIEQVATLALRAGEILQHNRAFLRKGQSRRESVDVNALVQGAVQLATVGTDSGSIAIRLDLAPLMPPVEVVRVEIEQVVLNLVRNAFDAMRDTPRSELWIRTAVEPDEIEVTVEDTGSGIPEMIRDQIFDAFVTTKSDGLGMGLAISRKIIETHGGRLWATANRSRGTTFHFTLPVASGGMADVE